MKRRMQLEAWHRRLVSRGAVAGWEKPVYAGLVLLSLLYGSLLWLRARLYLQGWLRRYRAGVPVISVGNLSLGGTGKTPVTDLLVRKLLGKGRRVAVVSRGYGRDIRDAVEVVSRGRGPELPPNRAGDEPYLLARRNPEAIVVVAARRGAGIERAAELGADVVVLDDGFQHLAVARELDILLLDARAPLGNGFPLPAGRMREFPSALQRADLAWFTRLRIPPADSEFRGIPVVASGQRLSPDGWDLDGRSWSVREIATARIAAFCGIADPESFFQALRECTDGLQSTMAFPDHVCYDEGALEGLRGLAEGVDLLVTTEKDAVKLLGRNLPCPCVALPLEVTLFGGEDVLERYLEHSLKQRELFAMGLSRELLEILACPACKGRVTYVPDAEEIRCPSCRLAYPVRDDIPVMLIDEARSIEE